MTRAAWLMLVGTWTVILYFTAKFFLMVLRTPPREDSEPPGRR